MYNKENVSLNKLLNKRTIYCVNTISVIKHNKSLFTFFTTN